MTDVKRIDTVQRNTKSTTIALCQTFASRGPFLSAHKQHRLQHLQQETQQQTCQIIRTRTTITQGNAKSIILLVYSLIAAEHAPSTAFGSVTKEHDCITGFNWFSFLQDCTNVGGSIHGNLDVTLMLVLVGGLRQNSDKTEKTLRQSLGDKNPKLSKTQRGPQAAFC